MSVLHFTGENIFVQPLVDEGGARAGGIFVLILYIARPGDYGSVFIDGNGGSIFWQTERVVKHTARNKPAGWKNSAILSGYQRIARRQMRFVIEYNASENEKRNCT